MISLYIHIHFTFQKYIFSIKNITTQSCRNYLSAHFIFKANQITPEIQRKARHRWAMLCNFKVNSRWQQPVVKQNQVDANMLGCTRLCILQLYLTLLSLTQLCVLIQQPRYISICRCSLSAVLCFMINGRLLWLNILNIILCVLPFNCLFIHDISYLKMENIFWVPTDHYCWALPWVLRTADTTVNFL